MFQNVLPRHFNNLEAARTIKTEPFLRTDRAVAHCVETSSLGVIVGDAGLGKTYAVDAALLDADRPVIRTLFGHQATPREVARQLVLAATGEAVGKTRFELTDECVDVMRLPHVAVIDEAQHLNRDCTFFLRYLLDHPETHVALLLIGGNGCWERIERDPMLASRVYRRIVFSPLTEAVLVKALPNYHPIYEGIERGMIDDVLESCDVTQLRTLAIFTDTAARICEEAGESKLNRSILAHSVALMGRGLDG